MEWLIHVAWIGASCSLDLASVNSCSQVQVQQPVLNFSSSLVGWLVFDLAWLPWVTASFILANFWSIYLLPLFVRIHSCSSWLAWAAPPEVFLFWNWHSFSRSLVFPQFGRLSFNSCFVFYIGFSTVLGNLSRNSRHQLAWVFRFGNVCCVLFLAVNLGQRPNILRENFKAPIHPPLVTGFGPSIGIRAG
jgi:hypothetical protein